MFANASSSLGQQSGRSVTVGAHLAIRSYQTKLSASTGNYSFVQAVLSRQYDTGAIQCACILDNEMYRLALSANRSLADVVHAYVSCTLTRMGVLGVGLGAEYHGTNTVHIDTTLGYENACTASLKRLICGYVCKGKIGYEENLGGVFEFVLLRHLQSGGYSLAVNVNHAQGVSLVLQ